MDKKFIAIIALLLSVGMLILAWPALNPGAEESGESEKTIAAGDYSSAYVERFFQKDKVIDIKITLADADYADMLQNPTKEEYKKADVIVDGEKAECVGFRVKGNSSLLSVARSESDRYSFKLDFDQYVAQQSLEGLTKLNLNNSFSDPSYMREYLSYDLLDQMGIPVPAFCYANVTINGESAGLYLAVEGIEEPFVERYYDNNDGTLYKPLSERGKGADLVYTDGNIESYNGLEAVTKASNGSGQLLVTMIQMLNQGQDLERYLHVDEILRYFAVNTVLVNMDSYLGQFTHNYYLYEENGIFSILPWDYNMSFGGFGTGQGNSQDQTSLYIDQPVSGTTLAQRPLLGKLLEVEEYKDLYHEYIKEFVSGPFALEKMTAEIERIAGLIRPYLEKDPTKFYSMEQFEQAIGEGSGIQSSQGGDKKMMGGSSTGLMKFVRERLSNVAQQLSGELPSEGDPSQASAINPKGGQQGELPRGDFLPGELPRGDFLPGDLSKGDFPPGFPQGERPPRGQWGGQQGGQMPADGFMLPEGRNERQPGRADQQMLLIVGAVLVLSAAVLIAFKLKTKYQV